MRIKKMLLTATSVGLLAVSLAIVNPVTSIPDVYAQSIDNDLGGSSGTSSSSSSSNASGFFDEGSVSQEDVSVGNFIKNHRGMTSEQLNTASDVISPLTNILGYLSGGVIAFIMCAIFFVTSLDLLYISVPFVRPFLYAAGTDGTGAMTAGRGGYGYGGGMMPQGGQQVTKKHQWVSDEAVQCASLLGGSSTSEGMGMMNRGGYGYQAQPQAQMSKGSVIKTYLIKRAFFMVLLAICIIILTSSVLLGTGVNLANWGIKIIDAINKITAVK